MSDDHPGPPEPPADPWRPIGERVQRAPSKPSSPEWAPVPGKPHLEQHRDGRLRTSSSYSPDRPLKD